MTIVTARHRSKRPAKPVVEIKSPRIVQHTPKGRAWRVALEPDQAADERVRAFIAKVVRPS